MSNAEGELVEEADVEAGVEAEVTFLRLVVTRTRHPDDALQLAQFIAYGAEGEHWNSYSSSMAKTRTGTALEGRAPLTRSTAARTPSGSTLTRACLSAASLLDRRGSPSTPS